MSFVVALALLSQSVELPAEVKGLPGQWIVVAPKRIDGGLPKWKLPPGLVEVDLSALFGDEIAKKAKGKVVTAAKAGRYSVTAWNAKGDLASDLAECVVVVGDAPKPPPDPVDPVDPDDPKVIPTPAPGLHALVVYETADLPAWTEAQKAVVWGATVQDYFRAKAARAADGSIQARFFDKDTPTTMSPAWVKDWMARPRKQLPWLILSNGSASFEGPLPADPAAMLAILKRIGG